MSLVHYSRYRTKHAILSSPGLLFQRLSASVGGREGERIGSIVTGKPPLDSSSCNEGSCLQKVVCSRDVKYERNSEPIGSASGI